MKTYGIKKAVDPSSYLKKCSDCATQIMKSSHRDKCFKCSNALCRKLEGCAEGEHDCKCDANK